MPFKPLTRHTLLSALRRLSELAAQEQVVLEVALYGGAVFTLVYGSRDSTRDVDALVRPADVAERLARKVAQEMELPEAWLSDDVRFFLSEREAKRSVPELDFGPGLRVQVPTAAYLLALKLRAFRPPLPGHPRDYRDIQFLLKKMEIHTVAGAEAILEKFFPEDPLTETQREELSRLITYPGSA